MKAIVGALAAAVAAVGFATASAGTAKADVYGHEGDMNPVAFAMELRPDNWVMTPTQARLNAGNICGQHTMGYTRRQLMDEFEVNYSIDMSVDLVMGADFHFCPAYDSLNMGDYGGPPDPLPAPPPPPMHTVEPNPPGLAV
jgi:hypothetical protein